MTTYEIGEIMKKIHVNLLSMPNRIFIQHLMRLTEQVETWEWFKLMFIDVGARRSWDGAMDRLAGAASKILPSCNLLHKAENFMIFLIAKTIVVNKKKIVPDQILVYIL